MNLKEFKVDFNDYASVRKAFYQLRTRYVELDKARNGTLSKKESSKILLDACFNIINTDISHCFNLDSLSPKKDYYVYVHTDPNQVLDVKLPKFAYLASLGVKYKPFYVGKGKGNRAYELNRNDSHRKVRQRIKSTAKDIEVFIVKDNLSELEALCLESKIIDILGLITNFGLLVNLDEGINASERRRMYEKDYNKLQENAANYRLLTAKES
jgi:hypothetical protein